MSNIIYKTNNKFTDLWLIDRDNLEKLHNIIEDSYKRLLERNIEKRDELILSEKPKNEIEEIMLYERYPLPEPKPINISLILSDGNKSVSNSLLKLMKDNKLNNIRVKELEIYYNVGDISVRIDYIGDLKSIDVFVSNSTDYLSQEIYSDILNWIESFRQPILKRKLWEMDRFTIWSLSFILFLTISFFLSFGKNSIQNKYEYEAIKLIEKGINKDNIEVAIELLLKLQVKDKLKEEKSFLPSWYGKFFFTLLIISILLSIKPNSVIAIGIGSKEIKYWKWWINFVSYSIPIYVFSTYLVPKIMMIYK